MPTRKKRFFEFGLNFLSYDFIFSKLHCPMVRIKFSLDIHPSKTTSYFLKNDRSFLEKRQVVSCKTTGHFSENNGLFFTNALMLPNVQRHIVKLILGIDYPTPRIGFVKNPIIDILRAHMYAHITGVFCFLLSQVSHYSL